MKSFLRLLRGINSSPPPLPKKICLPALGEKWTVKYRRTDSGSVQARCNGKGVLNVSGYISDKTKTQSALKRWLVRRGRESLIPWLDDLSVLAGMPYGKVAVRGQRTRWASCSSCRNINLNFKLLFLSPELVRYILNHELCHTVHLNHSKDFWRLVSSLEPRYRELNRRVKNGMEEVPEWARG